MTMFSLFMPRFNILGERIEQIEEVSCQKRHDASLGKVTKENIKNPISTFKFIVLRFLLTMNLDTQLHRIAKKRAKNHKILP